MLAVVLVASMFTAALWPNTPQQSSLLAWWLVTVTAALARIGLTWLWKHREADGDLRSWWSWFLLGTLVTGACWASTIPLFFFGATHEAQFFVAFVLAGISAGAITSLSADIRLILGYVYLLIGPLIFGLFQVGSDLYLLMGLMAIVYLLMISATALEYHRTLLESISRRISLKQTHDKLLAKEEETRRLFEHTPTGIFYYSREFQLVDCNAAFCQAFETDKKALIGLDMHKLRDKRIVPTLQAALNGESAHYQGPYHTLLSDKHVWGDIITAPIHGNNGEVIGAIGAFQDRTREYDALREVRKLALYDPLTELPNRKLLSERIAMEISRARRTQRFSSLLFLDFDDFKRVNDTYGHAVGDDLLIQIAARIQKTLREADMLARLGGDEFVVLATDMGDGLEEVMRHGLRVADKIHECCAEPFQLDERVLYTSASIGLVIIDQEHECEELLRRADTAMYRAKAQGKGKTAFYDASMDKAAQTYAHTVQRLRQSLGSDAFQLHFQPITRADCNDMIGAEVLLRWHDQELGSLPPDEFIPIAEEAHLIRELGSWVIEQACRQWRSWQATNACPGIKYLSLNVSALEFRDPHYVDTLRRSLARYDIQAQHIRLELTESALASDLRHTRAVLLELAEIGVQSVIDDFGTGYSSLAYLKQLPVSAIKIDRGFIHNIVEDANGMALIRIMIDIADQFGYGVIAEGVETKAQLEALTSLSTDIHYQGFFCAAPLAAAQFVELVGERDVRPNQDDQT